MRLDIYKYNKKDIIKILYSSARKYKENLLNKNILFIYENKKESKVSYIETIFNDYNFLHLTGIKYKGNAVNFFKDCLNHKLSLNNFEIKNIIFTKLKLEILENMMSINKFAKKIGTYNDNKTNIKIERVIGNIYSSIGFSNKIQDKKEIKYYYPKTLLQESFKRNVTNENKIIAILSKEKTEKCYSDLNYSAKGINILEICKRCSFKSLIDLDKNN